MKKLLSVLLMLALCLSCATFAVAEDTYFSFDRTVRTVNVGETLQTVLERRGEAAEGTVTYVSSAEKNATVDENGLVTALNRGSTTITASVKTERHSFRSTITLTIEQPPTGIALNGEKLSVYAPGDPAMSGLLAAPVTTDTIVVPAKRSVILPVSVEPANANNRRFTLSSSDETVATVSGNTLRPLVAGECDITAVSAANANITATWHVLVVQPVTRVTLSASAETPLYVGDTVTLMPAYEPEDATIKHVTWQSLNEKVATVDANGVVTAVGKGQVNIRATAADGSNRNATYTVQVKQQPTAITLKEADLVINVGRNTILHATVEPGSANNKRVTWDSSDESVATVNASGRVTPVAPGTCTITCASEEFPAIGITVSVTVHQPVTKVAFNDKELSFNINTTATLTWYTEPANASDTTVTFKSGNEQIATVDADGTVHGIKRGSCTITAIAADGSNRRGSIKVNVLQPVEGVHMQNDTIRVGVDEFVSAQAVMEPKDASNNHMTWSSADTSIAKVKGTRNRPTVTGVRWGTTTITGTTEDGGFTTTATVKVGNYDRAVVLTDVYLNGDEIKLVAKNKSNMNITRFNCDIACYDIYDNPLPCNAYDGSNVFVASYRHTLYEGDVTVHGRFSFDNFSQPVNIGRIVVTLTGYNTDEGYSRTIKSERRQSMEFKSANWVGPIDTEVGPGPVIP